MKLGLIKRFAKVPNRFCTAHAFFKNISRATGFLNLLREANAGAGSQDPLCGPDTGCPGSRQTQPGRFLRRAFVDHGTSSASECHGTGAHEKPARIARGTSVAVNCHGTLAFQEPRPGSFTRGHASMVEGRPRNMTRRRPKQLLHPRCTGRWRSPAHHNQASSRAARSHSHGHFIACHPSSCHRH